MAEKTCPKCGMTEKQWKGNNGQGVNKDNQTYCCNGCAENTGCTCHKKDRADRATDRMP